ncbi:MAG: hypothetical protein B6D64_08355 [Bacteroidetes bacterium 4484_276]|nr:MAG: hypothetical protein B6D64_08355 [Bacteroidetes bacterium 4484_276]OYT13814.1 MAG: hypothetical protein B6I19_03155 [Bacteroidetes bacterium 4572_114]
MKYPTNILMVIIMIFVFGCQPEAGEQITEKIIYEVGINNTDTKTDWWKNNLPGPARDNLVKWMMEGVKSGEIVACNEDGDPLSPEEAANIGRETVNMTFQRAEPPYDTFDTIVSSELDYRDITRIRFMEEWYYDTENKLISKKVTGMAPVIENYGPDGKLRGYEALFWVFDED